MSTFHDGTGLILYVAHGSEGGAFDGHVTLTIARSHIEPPLSITLTDGQVDQLADDLRPVPPNTIRSHLDLPTLDALDAETGDEIRAMFIIAQVLEDLGFPDAPARVLLWALARYAPEVTE